MKFEEVQTLIQQRKSTYPKQFTGERIADDTIRTWLELARWAPTHRLTEPWRYLVFSGVSLEEVINFHKSFYLENTPEPEQNIKKLEKFDIARENTSHLIAIVLERDLLNRIPEWEEVAALAMSVQNLYLGMDALGISGYWSTGNGTGNGKMEEYLGLNARQKLMGWFYTGIRNKELPDGNRIRKSVEEIAQFRT